MLKFFDANCFAGKPDVLQKGSLYKPEDHLKLMAGCNIEKALAYHISALEVHPTLGNKEMMLLVNKEASFVPLWVVMPNHTGEFYDPEELLQLMKENDVRAVRLFPRFNSLTYSLEDWSCGELFDELGRKGIPVLIDLEETDWSMLYKVCKNHENLNVIVTNVYYRHGRDIYALLKELPNFFVEISLYKNYLGIEHICRKFGAHRLVFGTGMPLMDPGPSVAMVIYADIPYEDKGLIASGNLQRLLGVW